MTATGPSSIRRALTEQNRKLADDLDPPSAPEPEQDRRAVVEEMRQAMPADHAGALELFRPPPAGGHES